MKLAPEDQEDIESELGYSVRGEREVRVREWFSLREADGGPREFAVVVNRLRVKKWAKENPEKRKAIANRYAAKPEVRQRQDAQARRRRLERFRASAAHLVTCVECGVEFCLVFPPRGGQPRKFCSTACEHRARYQRITPGARRVKRTGCQP